MPPRPSESEDFFVVSTDTPRYAHNGAHSSPVPIAADPGRPSNRDGKRSSAGRRSARHDPLDRLRALPEIRPIPWYPGKELPPAKSTESDRVQTRSACLMVSRGNVNDPPCTHCATGLGRFSLCISLDEFLSGACSTCHLAARGNSCSLRRKAAAGVKSEDEPNPDAGTTPAKPDEQTTSRPTTARHSEPVVPQALDSPPSTFRAEGPRQPQPESSWTPVDHSNSGMKRKRETLQGTDVWKPYVSPYRPIEMSGRSSPKKTKSPNTFAARDEVPFLNYIYRREAPANGTDRPDVARVPSPPSARANADKSWGPRRSTIRAPTSYTEHASYAARGGSESQSPSDQLLQQQHSRQAEVEGSISTKRSDKSAGSQSISRDTPLIDTLPRKKQNQIYGIIGGLQSGIKSCHAQAESMQKQLDTLQTLLGIDVEDDGDIRVAS